MSERHECVSIRQVRTLMKLLALLVGLLSSLAHAGVFTTEHVPPYPSDWPKLSGMSDTCVEVQGTFVDPNNWQWEREDNPGSPWGSKYGGTRVAAWIVFNLSPQDVHAASTKVKSRAFTISIDPDQSVTVKYLLDEEVVAWRSFTKDKWSCGKDGLTITTRDESGFGFDIFPGEWRMIQRSTIYRLHGNVYIKTTFETKAWVFYIVPQSFLNVTWFKFSELPK